MSCLAPSDDSGTQSDSYTYTAFGELLNQTGTTENSFLFTGEQFDGDLDQYYLRARYYDQSVGRFTQQDEWLGNGYYPYSLNKYTYANSDATNWIDPSGHYGLASLNVSSNMRNTLISQTIPNYSRYITRAMWGEVKDYVKDQAVEQVFGVVGEFVLTNMVQAVDDVAERGQSAQSFGSSAHKNLKDRIAETSSQLNRQLKKYNVRLEAEVFFFDAGKRTNDGIGDKRDKGSMGLDVILTNTNTGKVVLAFDLKTGKAGTSKSKLPGYKKRHNNAPIIDVFINRRK
ncbi:RHS repeat-associated core domain-containing protein [Pseudoalteromonas sp. bablab_jr011]|uniref:RHS repeat-associated core domain-containing protein n=1 Tax=Pseudoalteromonas sp. bablab_jr011 TaxID=2755062 RepID=UPI0018F7C416|nr:RHS repeat-associated core domain-containing protein [Pseudoalteromonas sp. bablab_jr011]